MRSTAEEGSGTAWKLSAATLFAAVITAFPSAAPNALPWKTEEAVMFHADMFWLAKAVKLYPPVAPSLSDSAKSVVVAAS